ncbi:hypothetical protein TNCV_4946191 [Trichonephila clavipes]|nr:hypothetical protein TNCV_4946191 [Trichonephila clavipes]
MAAVDFLHHENPPTWAGVEPAILGADNTSACAIPIYANSEFRDFQMSSIRVLFEKKRISQIAKIGNRIEEVVNLDIKINLEMDRNEVQKLLDCHNQELTMDELIKMHEKEQNIEAFESLDSV